MADIPSNYDILASHTERVHKAKDDLLREENQAIEEKARSRSQGMKDITEIRDRARREAELANRVGLAEIEGVKDLNLKNLQALNQANAKKMADIAEKTAKEIERLEARSVKEIHEFQNEKMEKLLAASTRAEDPFYRARQFPTEIEELEDAYNIKITLPPYEARDVNITGFSNQLKVSFNRHFEADTPINPLQSNLTRSHESVTETYYLPTNINFKKVSRFYADGVLSIRVSKANPLQFNPIRDGEDAEKDRKNNSGSTPGPTSS